MGSSIYCNKIICCPESRLHIYEQETIKEHSDDVSNNGNKSNSGRKDTQIRMVSTYNHNNNYLTYLNNVVHIQQSFRKHYSSSRRHNQKTKPNDDDHNADDSLSKSKVLHVPIVKPVKKVSFMQSIENESPISTYAILAQTIFQTTLTILPDGSIIDENFRGYFVKKKDVKHQYKGFNIKGKKEGFGIIKWKDHSIYKGTFKDNQAYSVGLFKEVNNGEFKGYYNENKPNGYGLYLLNGKVSEGYWIGNSLNGYCRQYSDDDSYYQGELTHSIKNGIGLFRWADGSIYNGEWKNDKMNGYGVLSFSDDKLYAGEWKDSKMHGYGEYDWLKGKKYIGNYQYDKKHGFGIYQITKRPLLAYLGFWKKGIYNGLGIEIKNKQFKYGIWTNGKRTQKFKGKWEISKYILHNQLSYLKFLELSEEDIISFLQQNF